MNEPIDHHYIPQFYLSKWRGADNKLQYFRWINGQLISNRISTKGTGFEELLYSLNHGSPEDKQIIEKFLRDHVDTPASKVLNKLIEEGVEGLSEEERRGFTKFLLSLRYRGPHSIDKLRSEGQDILIKSLSESQDEYEQLKGPNDPPTLQEFLDKVTPDFATDLGLIAFANWLCDPAVIDNIIKMRWYIRTVKRADYDFLTSDNPLSYGKNDNSNKLYIGIPLSPKKMFFAFNSSQLEEIFRNVGENKLVKHCNISMTNKAIDKVYSTDERQIQFIKNHFKVA